MDAHDSSYIELISQVGFPIVACLFLGYVMDRRLLKILILLNVLVDRVQGIRSKHPKRDDEDAAS